jgi:hypothetical protein
MPRLEDLHLQHHPVGEVRRGGEVREVFDHEEQLLGSIQLGLTLQAVGDVGPEGLHAEAYLGVEEQVDFVGS